MGSLASRVPDNADKIVRKAVLAADAAVVTATPVDTGRARSNWIVQIGTASEETIDAYAKGEAGATGAANASAAMAQAAAVVAGYRGGSGQEVHITNNLPYIGPLNEGTSRQAPAGFVRTAVAAGIAAVEGARLLD